jgi:acyl-CoA reductase-like NAD-dependent aldehyde dehydrogenase/ABC-type branched-subunit amino acid transport system ATPase component
MLEVAGLSLSYGKHLALDGIDLQVGKGETVVILGANGAGKSSLLKAVAGLAKPADGSLISLDGEALMALPAHRIVERGIALVPEGRGIFAELTVDENLSLGANPERARAGEGARRKQVYDLFPKLRERRAQRVGTMSGGEQQMVAIGRALMSAPDLLLLDEPSLGLAPIVVGELFDVLRRIGQTGVGLLVVEQNVKASLAIADRGYLMEAGRIVGRGTAGELMNDKAVQRAFLGAPGGDETNGEGSRAMDMVGLLIDGESLEASGGESFERVNPITGDVATRAAAATPDDARRAADAAARAFPEWSATPPGQRRKLLIAASDALREKTDEIVKAMAEEIGATAGWAMFNVGLAADMLLEAAALTTQINGEVIPSNRPGTMAMAIRQPAGVVLSMAPWNAPVILGVRSIATPLACGNTVVMKTSEICPRTHRLIVEAVQGAGLPDGVLNVISNAPDDAPEIVEALIAHPAVRRINFTGSTRVGRKIAETAGRHLKPVLLELGGKAPMIVLDDADLDQAVAAAAFGAYMNQGQICMSTERLVVDEKVADAFCEKLAAKVKTLTAGDPREGNTPLGSVVDTRATERIVELIRDAVDKGAVLAAGGSAEGTIVEATLLDRVTPSMRIYHEESFGPVVSIIRVGSVDEAVRVANDTEYGLSAAVFGSDVNRALGVARRIESGICHVNGPTVHDEAQMPFGGVKESGYGRFGGKAGIEEFTELRWITIQDGALHYPI